MRYCKTCLQPDTRLNAVFNHDCICPACVDYKRSKSVDWAERFEIIENLSKFAKWIGIKPSMLSLVLNKHRNPKIWSGIAPNKYERRAGTWSAEKLAANIPLEEYGTAVDLKFDLGSVLDTSGYPDSFGLIATSFRAPKIDKSYKVNL